MGEWIWPAFGIPIRNPAIANNPSGHDFLSRRDNFLNLIGDDPYFHRVSLSGITQKDSFRMATRMV